MSKSGKSESEWLPEERLEAWSERSLSIPIFIVEGPDDVIIYREIATHRSLMHLISIESVNEMGGGRSKIFQLYEALSSSLQKKAHLVFCADKDIYVFDPIPEKYKGIHFTNGYSIENDLFTDGKDLLMQKLYPEEKERFEAIINSVALWFAFEVELIFSGRAAAVKFDISLLNEAFISPNSHELSGYFLQMRNFIPPLEDWAARIYEGYSQLLRGKFLFQILLRLSMDRIGKKPFRIGKDEKDLWNDCLAEGLRDSNAPTNCNRIVSIMQRAIGQSVR